MISIGRISEVWRYPVKSMGGEQMNSASVTPEHGVEGDRHWALTDEEMQEIVNGRRIPGIMMLDARFLVQPGSGGEPHVEIKLPDADPLRSDDPYVHAALSAHLGRRVTLWPLQPKSDKKYYKYNHMVTPKDMRKILGRPAVGPLPDLSRLRLPDLLGALRFVSPPGTHFDFNRLHFITTASLKGLQEMVPNANVDVRRFRPNFVIDTAASQKAFAEHGWAGWRIRVGDLEIACRSPAIRCTMPGQRLGELPAEPELQLAIRKELNEDFGVYADPLNAGVLKVGDEVQLIPPRSRLVNGLKKAATVAFVKALGAPNPLVDKLEQKALRSKKTPGIKKNYRMLKVVERREETTETVSLLLVPERRPAGPDFLPGQHLLFRFELPGHSKSLYRSYSLSGSPSDGSGYRITVKREAAPASKSDAPQGTVSNHLADQVKVGDKLWARGPLGAYALRPGDKTPVALISMGIGVTPHAAMAHAIAEVNPKRPVWLLQGVKSQADFALGSELKDLAASTAGLNLAVRESQGGGKGNNAKGNGAGRIDFAWVKKQLPSLDFDFYLCGKPEFMRDLYQALTKAKVAPGRIHAEFFGEPEALDGKAGPAPRDGSAPADGKAYRVLFARSGQEVAWEPSAGSLLDLAERHGLPVESGCRYGNCHSCQTTLVSGEVHQTPGAEPTGRDDAILLCCSRPTSDVVINA